MTVPELVIIAIITACGDPIEIITFSPDESKVEIVKVTHPALTSLAHKLKNQFKENIIEITEQTETVCS